MSTKKGKPEGSSQTSQANPNRRANFEKALKSTPGQLEHFVNTQVARSKHDPRVKEIKQAADKAVKGVLTPHDSVMLAGSSRKGTATRDSDVDMYVRSNTGEKVTARQRAAIAAATQKSLPANAYSLVGNRVVASFKSKDPSYPDFDLAFHNFKGEKRSPPCPPPFGNAKPALGQAAVRVMKEAQQVYGLPRVSSTAMEKYVSNRIQGCQDVSSGVRKIFQGIEDGEATESNLRNEAWRNAARHVLKQSEAKQ